MLIPTLSLKPHLILLAPATDKKTFYRAARRVPTKLTASPQAAGGPTGQHTPQSGKHCSHSPHPFLNPTKGKEKREEEASTGQ